MNFRNNANFNKNQIDSIKDLSNRLKVDLITTIYFISRTNLIIGTNTEILENDELKLYSDNEAIRALIGIIKNTSDAYDINAFNFFNRIYFPDPTKNYSYASVINLMER